MADDEQAMAARLKADERDELVRLTARLFLTPLTPREQEVAIEVAQNFMAHVASLQREQERLQAEVVIHSTAREGCVSRAVTAEADLAAAREALRERLVFIVAECEAGAIGGIVGVFGSHESAEARIAEQLVEYPDMERSDYLIIRERIRGLDAALQSVPPQPQKEMKCN